ncbi:restriction endonuclease subunit S [Methylotenera sp.]|uniref:restriction endonuclease subunit S n=1 Tax=Methylotenera sp. TaxID=2051956 RepID=UPI002486FC39|nr:restriction endonuclease subunit S [Methylotenera sp.]MDI1297819.1 restriction endonuclease subunit S [Methylotenera sp.]
MKAGWQVKPLAAICKIFADGDWIESKDQSAKGVRLIQTGNVGKGFFKDRGEKARYISKETFARLRCTEIFENDCLISRLPDPVGRSCLLPDTGEQMITAVDCTIVRFDSSQFIPEFFVYYTQSNDYLSNIDAETSGTTRKRISRSKLGEIPIPVPSVQEQQRIVAILDDAFEQIAIVRANTEKNLQNARALFESHLQNVFTVRPELVEGRGELVALSELATDITDGDHMPPPKSVKGIPFITISNVNKQTRQIDFSDTFTVANEYYNKLKPNRKPQKGDVLYTVTGSYGIPIIVNYELEFCFQRHIGLIRPNKNTNSQWLYYLLLSPLVFQQASDGATGTAQKTVSLKVLRNIKVPKMSLAKQDEIVFTLDALAKETQRLESLYQRKLKALDALKKSLLHKAFAGEL